MIKRDEKQERVLNFCNVEMIQLFMHNRNIENNLTSSNENFISLFFFFWKNKSFISGNFFLFFLLKLWIARFLLHRENLLNLFLCWKKCRREKKLRKMLFECCFMLELAHSGIRERVRLRKNIYLLRANCFELLVSWEKKFSYLNTENKVFPSFLHINVSFHFKFLFNPIANDLKIMIKNNFIYSNTIFSSTKFNFERERSLTYI